MRDYICEKLLITHAEYDEILVTAPLRYKKYYVPKKSDKNKKRQICHPAKELKMIQRVIAEDFLSIYPVHDSAMAYRKNVSAYKNGLKHANNAFIAKIDFADFFNSIKKSDFLEFLQKKNVDLIDKQDFNALANFLFYYDYKKKKQYLSIGAPSSPIVSNIMLYDFDNDISNFCTKNDVTYTRYADDISISSLHPKAIKTCYDYIIDNIDKTGIQGIEINKSKTKFLSMKNRRIITGYIISNDGKVSIGRTEKRKIRAMLYNALNQELENQGDWDYLTGILGHIKSFDEQYWNSLKNTYGDEFWKKLQIGYNQKKSLNNEN